MRSSKEKEIILLQGGERITAKKKKEI